MWLRLWPLGHSVARKRPQTKAPGHGPGDPVCADMKARGSRENAECDACCRLGVSDPHYARWSRRDPWSLLGRLPALDCCGDAHIGCVTCPGISQDPYPGSL